MANQTKKFKYVEPEAYFSRSMLAKAEKEAKAKKAAREAAKKKSAKK